MSNNKQIIYLDSSLLRHAGCRKKLFLSSQGWRSKYANYKATYGNAIHAGLRYFYTHLRTTDNLAELQRESTARALKFFEPFQGEGKPDDIYDNMHLDAVMKEYFQHYGDDPAIEPITDFGSNAITESKFNFPFYESENYIVNLCGTIDLVATYYGELVIPDHKTTASKNPDWFLRQQAESLQFKFYSWCLAKLAGCDYLPVFVNGIFLREWTARTPKYANFQRGEVIRFEPSVMEKFGEYIEEQAKQLVREYETMEVSQEFSLCNQGFPCCQFAGICSTPEHLQSDILMSKYEQKDYNPMKFQAESED